MSVCSSVCPNKSREIIQNRMAEANFYVFRYNFAYMPLILISKRLAESSEHAGSESTLCFRIFAYKGFKIS
jgi:hypothetical protein